MLCFSHDTKVGDRVISRVLVFVVNDLCGKQEPPEMLLHVERYCEIAAKRLSQEVLL